MPNGTNTPTRQIRIDSGEAVVVRVDRSDVGDLARATRTPEGYVVVQGRAVRVGVLTYRDPKTGASRRELVPPDELFDPPSVASLDHKPLTMEHPGRRVAPNSWRQDAAGHVTAPKPDGDFLSVTIAIMDAKAIQAARDGVVELSTVRTCDIDPTPGTFRGERYDAIQRNIRYRELALTESARGGSVLAIRMDASYAPFVEPDTLTPEAPMLPARLLLALAAFGVTRSDSEDQIADKVTTAADDLAAAKAEAATAKTDAAKVRQDSADVARGELAARIAFADRRRELLDAADAAGVRLDSKALSGMDNDAIAEAVVVAIDPTTPKGKSADYHAARLDSWKADGRFDTGSADGGAYIGARVDRNGPGRGDDNVRQDRADAPATSYDAGRRALSASRSTAAH